MSYPRLTAEHVLISIFQAASVWPLTIHFCEENALPLRRIKDVETPGTFNLAAEELQSKAHPGRSGPLWVNSDEAGQ